MRLIGLAPMAVPMASSELKGLLASPTVKLAMASSSVVGDGAAFGGQTLPNFPVNQGEIIFGKSLFRKLERLYDIAREEDSLTRALRRQDSIDNDIAVLKSCSRSFKISKQRERDLEKMDFMSRAGRVVYGAKDD